MLEQQGILAIRHALTPDADLGFYEEWYVDQHLPERLGCPGWREARRYEAIGPDPRWFTFYLADDPAAFATDAYRARLNDPTAETRRVMPWFTEMSRTVASVACSSGDGIGGIVHLATTDRPVDPGSHDWPALIASIVGPAAVLSAHVWLAADLPSQPKTIEAGYRRGEDARLQAAILVEATRVEAVASIGPPLVAALGPGAISETYRLLNRRLA